MDPNNDPNGSPVTNSIKWEEVEVGLREARHRTEELVSLTSVPIVECSAHRAIIETLDKVHGSIYLPQLSGSVRQLLEQDRILEQPEKLGPTLALRKLMDENSDSALSAMRSLDKAIETLQKALREYAVSCADARTCLGTNGTLGYLQAEFCNCQKLRTELPRRDPDAFYAYT